MQIMFVFFTLVEMIDGFFVLLIESNGDDDDSWIATFAE